VKALTDGQKNQWCLEIIEESVNNCLITDKKRTIETSKKYSHTNLLLLHYAAILEIRKHLVTLIVS
jgi:hypothetical protein